MSDPLTEAIAALDRELDIEPDATAAEAPETTEATGEAADDGQPRNPDGTFAPKPGEDEPDAATEAADQVKQDLILGRFKTPEEVIKAYEELDRAFGQRSQEWGELKKELEAIREQTAPAQPVPQQYDANATADYFLENPTSILPTIQQAYNSGDRNLVYLGIAALEDIDRPLAEGLRIEIAKRDAIAEMTPHIARNEQADFNTNFANAWNQVKADHPDIDQFADQILQAAQADPDTLRGLNEGTPDSTKRVLTNLYKIAAFDASKQDGVTLTEAAKKAAEQEQQEADLAKREGFVGTGTQRVEAEQVSEGEQWLADIGLDKALERYYQTD